MRIEQSSPGAADNRSEQMGFSLSGILKKSIAVQMTLLVLGSTALVLAAVEGYSYFSTRQMILKSGETVAVHLTRSMARRIEQEFRAVKKIPETLALYLTLLPPEREPGLQQLLLHTVTENEEVFGSGLFSEPGALFRQVTAFAPYYYRKDGKIEYVQLARGDYRYWQKHFYVYPEVFGEPVWSAPYVDEGRADLMMVNYSVPFYQKGKLNQAGGFAGVVTSDLSLRWLTELTRSVHMGKKGFSFIITETGIFVAHPDESFLLRESIFSRADKLNRPELRAIGRRMIREEQGFMPTGFALAGEPAYLAWDRIPATGWVFGTVVVKSELFQELDVLAHSAVGIGLLGVLLLVGVSILVARSMARPLIAITGTTRQIAKGDLDVDLSGIRRQDEIGTLAAAIGDMAAGLKQKEFIRATFGRYLTNEVVNRLLESKDGLKLGGESRELTLMMSDLRGFTALTANMDPETVISFLNRYLGQMVDILVRHKGVIDEIIGDGILAFFGAPDPMADHTRQAVVCALEMQLAMEKINEQNRQDGLARLEMGIAVHTGQVVVGNIGSETRSKYGAVGSEVNFAGRMESYSVGGQVLVSQAVRDMMGDELVIRKSLTVQMKGMPEPVQLYDVLGLVGRAMLPEKEETKKALDRPLDALVQRLNKKSLDHQELSARLTHASQTTAVMTLDVAIGQWEDLKVAIPAAGAEFYGKVINAAETETGQWEIAVRTTSLSPEAYGIFKG